jgi:hypothetical protein
MRCGSPSASLLIVGALSLTVLSCRQQGPATDRAATAAERVAATTAATGADVALPDGAGGWTARGAPTAYDRESIYSYIDGHAEVYMAYGFKRCVSRRYAGPQGEADIVADVFELASADDAFGMFTHDRDGAPAGVGNDSLFRHGWLSSWAGPYFLSIVAEGDTARSREAVIEIGRTIAAGLPRGDRPPAIVGDLPARDLDPRSVRFLRHPQILNTHVFVADENVLGLAPDTAAVLGKYQRGADRGHLLIVEYPEAARAAAAADGFRKGVLNGATGQDPVAVRDRGFFAARAEGRRLHAVLGAATPALARDLVGRGR